ncbi:MAG: family transposase [Verrucomicrobiales bacterium]|nr:family transposase [Verrucomicrobiales bacterium]
MQNKNANPSLHTETHQTVHLEVRSAGGSKSIAIGFTDQKVSSHGGLALMGSFIHRSGFAQRLAKALPHQVTSPNARPPVEHGLSFVAGVLAGAEKFSQVALLRADPAVPEFFGIKAISSQPTLSRFFDRFEQFSNLHLFNDLFRWSLQKLNSRKEGYTLDLDSTPIIHEDGHQEGVRPGYTPRGLKPGHHPLVAALAEPKLIAGFWLRSGNAHTANNAGALLDNILRHLPSQIRVGLVRADAGFSSEEFLCDLEARGLKYIVVAQLKRDIQKLCRHDDTSWQSTGVEGIDVCEVDWPQKDWPAGRRLLVVRQKLSVRPDAKGKVLLEVPGYQFQAFLTNLPRSVPPLEVWRTYNPRADIENRIKELAHQFGLKSFCCQNFWATEAACSLVCLAYNLSVLFQHRLCLTKEVEGQTLRWQIFHRAAIFSRAQGRSTLKFYLPGKWRAWWLQIIEKLCSTLPSVNCNSVEFLPT